MSRIEISGYIQIVLGIVGIVTTILTAPQLLDAVGTISAGGTMPSEFQGASGAIKIFCIMLILSVLTFLVTFGVAITLSTLTKALGAHHPLIASTGLTVGLVASALTTTLAVLRIPYWVPGFVGSLGLFVVGFVACRDDERLNATAFASLASIVVFLLTGLGTIIASGSA
jgi:hypothetical protein